MEEYNRDLDDLNKSTKKGISKEAWLADRIQDGAKGMAVNQYRSNGKPYAKLLETVKEVETATKKVKAETAVKKTRKKKENDV